MKNAQMVNISFQSLVAEFGARKTKASLYNGFKKEIPRTRQHPGVAEMPAPLLHLSISCECAARDCCVAFSSLKGVAEQHTLCMSCLQARERIFKKLSIIIEVNLNTLMVRLITGSSLKSVFFLHYQYPVICIYLMCQQAVYVFSLVICL